MAKKKQELTSEELLAAALVREEDWPYEVPGNWVWTYGKVIFKPMSSKKPTGEQFEYIDIDAIDNQLKQVSQPKTIETSEAPSRARRELKTDDVLFSLVRPYLENIAYIDDSLEHCIASTGFFVCRPTEIIIGKYLYYLMTSEYVVKGLNSFMKGDNSPSIRKDDIEGFSYPLPPLAEQQRIVDRIESLFDKLDQAKDLIQDALDSFATRKAAILHQAFTGQLTKKWREAHGVGMESWEEKYFSEIGTLERGRSKHRPRNAPELFGGDYPFIQTGDVANANIFIKEHKKNLSEFGLKQSRLFPKGTLCITIAANIGDVAILDYDCCFPDSVVGFTPNEETISKFIYYYMCVIKADLEHFAPATAQKNINLRILNEIQIKMPSYKEQQEIVPILDDVFSKEQNVQELCDCIDQIEAMKKTILGKAFRGEMGTNMVGEDSAVAILNNFCKTVLNI